MFTQPIHPRVVGELVALGTDRLMGCVLSVCPSGASLEHMAYVMSAMIPYAGNSLLKLSFQTAILTNVDIYIRILSVLPVISHLITQSHEFYISQEASHATLAHPHPHPLNSYTFAFSHFFTMHYKSTFLAVAPMVMMARAGVEFDLDETPSQCRDICRPIADLYRSCQVDLRGDDNDREEDQLEVQCFCTNSSFDVGTVAAQCQDCVRQNRGSGSNGGGGNGDDDRDDDRDNDRDNDRDDDRDDNRDDNNDNNDDWDDNRDDGRDDDRDNDRDDNNDDLDDNRDDNRTDDRDDDVDNDNDGDNRRVKRDDDWDDNRDDDAWEGKSSPSPLFLPHMY